MSVAHNLFLSLTARVKAEVDPSLNALLEREIAEVGGVGREVQAMLQAAQSLLCRGGKRLRAGLLVASYQAWASESQEPLSPFLVHAAQSIELLQAYFLVHDDWMDQDATRRGGPTVHAALTRQFKDPHLGACGAVLAGDYLMTLAAREYYAALEAEGRSETSLHPRTKELLQAFTTMQLAAVAGQQLDVIGITRDSLKVYELKTSSYTVCGPLTVGALLADAPSTSVQRLQSFALPLGLAFQLRDDLLGVFGDPADTGKPFGSDLSAGKWTWLAQWFSQHASTPERQAFDSVFAKGDTTVEQLTRAVAALDTSGARAAAEEQIALLRRQAEHELELLNLAPSARRLFEGAISTLIDRDY